MYRDPVVIKSIRSVWDPLLTPYILPLLDSRKNCEGAYSMGYIPGYPLVEWGNESFGTGWDREAPRLNPLILWLYTFISGSWVEARDYGIPQLYK